MQRALVIQPSAGATIMKKRIKNSIDIAMSQYHILHKRFITAQDDEEKTVLNRRLLNLLGVIQFLISVQEINSSMGPFV